MNKHAAAKEGRRALRRGRELLGDHTLFLPLVLALTPEGFSRRITRRTDVVIEGFPRSGNTFAVWALRLSQPKPPVIASHVHVPAQVKLAVRRNLPTLVVVRAPVDAVASLIVAAPHVRIAAGLREYAHHHEQLLPLRSHILVARFEDVTTDFGAVTQRLNLRFGTTFAEFAPSEENNRNVFDAIDHHHDIVSRGTIPPTLIPRPTAARADELERVRERVLESELATRLRRAEASYTALLGDSDG